MRPKRDAAASAPGTPEHAEWLLDEAIAESFPASDPPAASYPGSTLERLIASERRASASSSCAGAVMVTAALFAVGLLLARSGRRKHARAAA